MTDVDHQRAAQVLLEARRTRHWLDALPPDARPRDEADAYAIQDLVAAQLGPVVGWKIGAATAQSEPHRAPIHAQTLFDGGHLSARMLHVIGVEAEIAYRFARDLPPRDTPYTRTDVLDALATVHPAIEIVDTRFVALSSVDPLCQRADQQNHGALVVGAGLSTWSNIDPPRQPVRLTINGKLVADRIGGNSAVDPFRLLEWLANRGARSLGGVRAHQVVTTGSCTGTIFVDPGAQVHAEFPGLGAIELDII